MSIASSYSGIATRTWRDHLICVDAVLPPMGDSSGTSAKLLDLLMMAGICGKERTLKQCNELYRAAGFGITSVTPFDDNFGTSIVEVTKA